MYVRSAKNIPEDELAMRPICTRHTRKGRSATYRQAYYRKACFDEIVEEEKKDEVRRHMQRMHRSKALPFGRGIVGAAVALINSLCVFLINETCKASIHPGLAVLYSFLMGYGILQRSIGSSPGLI